MLVLLTILVVVSTVVSITVLLRNRQTHSLEDNPKEFELPPYRPLFAPDEEEMRAFEREEKARQAAEIRENERRLAEEKIETVKKFQCEWQAAPDRRKTIELLHLAAQSENGQVFADIAAEIIRFSKEDRVKNLSKKDLADLLDSHLRTLPQQERTSGALFRLKEEIAELRRKSEAQSDYLEN